MCNCTKFTKACVAALVVLGSGWVQRDSAAVFHLGATKGTYIMLEQPVKWTVPPSPLGKLNNEG